MTSLLYLRLQRTKLCITRMHREELLVCFIQQAALRGFHNLLFRQQWEYDFQDLRLQLLDLRLRLSKPAQTGRSERPNGISGVVRW